MAHRRWEREQGRRDATEDMSEDLSEGEKGDVLGETMVNESPRKKFQRNFSNLEVWSDNNKEKKLYIVLIRYSSLCMFITVLDLNHSLDISHSHTTDLLILKEYQVDKILGSFLLIIIRKLSLSLTILFSIPSLIYLICREIDFTYNGLSIH